MAYRSAASSIISMKAPCPQPCGSARCFETGIRGHMTRSDFGKLSALAAAVLAIVLAGVFDPQAQQAIKKGDVLSGQLNAMRRPAHRKPVHTLQLLRGPQRPPAPSRLRHVRDRTE